MLLTRFLINSFRKHKGLAVIALLYYFYSVGKKTLRENQPAAQRRTSLDKT